MAVLGYEQSVMCGDANDMTYSVVDPTGYRLMCHGCLWHVGESHEGLSVLSCLFRQCGTETGTMTLAITQEHLSIMLSVENARITHTNTGNTKIAAKDEVQYDKKFSAFRKLNCKQIPNKRNALPSRTFSAKPISLEAYNRA